MKGGYRPGAGRPPKVNHEEIQAAKNPKIPADVLRGAKMARLSPLEYMLNVMNDENTPDERRDRMAIAAAPFLHSKPSDAGKLGKKEERELLAKEKPEGGIWDGLLN